MRSTRDQNLQETSPTLFHIVILPIHTMPTSNKKSKAKLGAESPYVILGLSDPQTLHSLPENVNKEPYHYHTDADVARAYRRASLIAHPDKHDGSADKFEAIQRAYDLLKTADKRKQHYEYGSRGAPGPGDHLGAAVDQLVPLGCGVVGGIGAVLSYAVWESVAGMFYATLLSLATGAAWTTKVPVGQCLQAGLGGMVVGSVITALGWSGWKIVAGMVSSRRR